jgi:hypothetical protein
MSEPLLRALTRLRGVILDDESLVRAVASGRQRGTQPTCDASSLRYVDSRPGASLRVTAHTTMSRHIRATTSSVTPPAALDDLLDQPFANWHVETTSETHQPASHQEGRSLGAHPATRRGGRGRRDHDRDKGRLLPEDDPVFRALGLSDHEGRMKPSRQGKYRQVEEFLRILDASVGEALEKGHLRRPTPEEPRRSWTSAAETPTSPSSPSGSSPRSAAWPSI